MNTGPEASLEGWDPGPVGGATLAEVVELAFDYRGDITLRLDDGRQVDGYLFNRDRDVADHADIRQRRRIAMAEFAGVLVAGEMPLQRRQRLDGPEIGRASCRERVCSTV